MSRKEKPRYSSTPCSRYCEKTWSSGASAAALPTAAASSPLLVMKKEKRPCAHAAGSSPLPVRTARAHHRPILSRDQPRRRFCPHE